MGAKVANFFSHLTRQFYLTQPHLREGVLVASFLFNLRSSCGPARRRSGTPMEATAQLPMTMANLMLCCLLVVVPAFLPVGSTYPRPNSRTFIARIAAMMSHEALLL